MRFALLLEGWASTVTLTEAEEDELMFALVGTDSDFVLYVCFGLVPHFGFCGIMVRGNISRWEKRCFGSN